MKPVLFVVLLILLSINCAPLSNIKHDINPPLSLGEIGKSNTSFLHRDMQAVGKPSLSRPIPIQVREVPFVKSAYKKYTELNKMKGQETKVQFVDSLPIKPKYISLEISDMVALADQLNEEANKGIRSYLAKDAANKILVQVSAMASNTIVDKVLLADGIFLTQDRNNLLGIELVSGSSREFVVLSEFEVFDYGTGSFCWGLDRYGNERIEVIALNGDSCPKETEPKAYKLDGTKPYLKL